MSFKLIDQASFKTIRSARTFKRGYAVPRVIVRVNGGFELVHPSTAARKNLRVVH